jgi:hypothetical protein
MLLTVAKLRPAVENHAILVDRALSTLFANPEAPINLDGLAELTGPGEEVTDYLLAVLNEADVKDDFVAYLRARGVDLAPPASLADIWDDIAPHINGQTIGQPEDPDFDFNALAAFIARAKAFRCRVKVGGDVAGSGAFVSPRLVLTAEHVVTPYTEIIADHALRDETPDRTVLPKVAVIDGNGDEHPAHVIWWLPVHPNERNGDLPPDTAARTHCDVALLKVVKPVGHIHGRITLPNPPTDWIGTRRFALVHYPKGNARGFTPGAVRRRGGELRLQHDVDTAGGSSGGAGFDRDFAFLGLHQGRVDQRRQLVPYDLYAQDADFRGHLNRDVAPRLLWSLDGDIDGPLIIGRQAFFVGLSHMLENPNGRLKGIWMRRLPSARTAGLSFSYDMLQAFLDLQEATTRTNPQHRCIKVSTALAQSQLIAPLAEALLTGGADNAAQPGVRRGETSPVAEARDRAEALAKALDRQAKAADQIYWLFFEQPPNEELSDNALVELEHLIDWISLQQNLRLIIAGFEQYRFAPLQFQRIEDAAAVRKPGLLVDPIGTFGREDVRVTLQGAIADLTPNEVTSAAVLDDLVDQVVQGLPETRPGAFRRDDFGTAVDRIRALMKLRMGVGA